MLSCMLAVVAAMVLAANTVVVRSPLDCPSADSVSARLRPLLPSATPSETAPDVALLTVAGPANGALALRLRLIRSDGSAVGDRRLVLRGSCDEVADAVAGIVAAWETEFATTDPSSQPARGVEAAALSAAPADEPQPGLGLWVGLSGGLAVIGGNAATGTAEAVTGRAASPWQARLALTLATTRRRQLDVGEVSWDHTAATLGLMLRSRGPTWRLSVDAGPIFGWSSVAGHHYAQNDGRRSFEYGGGFGLRVSRTLRRFSLWFDVRVHAWAVAQRALLAGSETGTGTTLPNVDAIASLGASASFFP